MKREKNIMNKIGFGWKHSTHKVISEEIANQINKSLNNNMKIDIETLKESCVYPDFVRKKKSSLIHGHFADIDNPSVDPPDAYKLFSEYTKKAIAANKNAQSNEREYYKRDKYLGYALHFLQDMLNPFHVVFKPLQNFLFLYGTGANGKSVFIKIIAALFNDENVSYLKVQDMYEHKMDNLNGKKLNISSELSGNFNQHGQIETIKEIAEGATITVDPKHIKPYKIYNPPKLIMSANTKLTGGGQNDGLIRRLMMIPFEVQIPKADRNPNLHKEIIKEEMSGVLNWAVEGLIRLVKNDMQFTQSNILDTAIEEYREETDQVYLYIKECVGQYVGDYPDDAKLVRKVNELPLIYNEKIMIPTKTIYSHYVLWAKEIGVHEMKQTNFISKLCEKLRTKAVSKRFKSLNITKGYVGGDLAMTYESKTGNVIVGFSISGDLKINVNGMNVTVMETIQQGGE